MKAVILAGGFGTRMRPLTFSRPKPLLPLLNRPVTAHILDHLREHGVTEVAITTNYLREQIVDYFGAEYRGMKLYYPVEEQPLGTAGCVKNIEEWFDDTFIVMQGDCISDINLTELVAQHRYFSGLATVAAVRVNDPWNYGVMETADNGSIKQFFEKPLMNQCPSNLANTGIYVLEPEALGHIPKGTFYDFAKDLFPILLESQSLYAHPVEAFWVDVGRPDGYMVARKWLMAKIEAEMPSSAELGCKIEGKIRLGENVRIGNHSHLFGPVLIGDNVTLEKGCVVGPYTVLGSGVTIREYTVVNGAVLFDRIELGANEEVSASMLAEGVRVGASGRIQSDVMIGVNCHLAENVSVISGSRIWPNIQIAENSTVSGTLRRFVPSAEVHEDPKWALRTVSPDEGFYFNKLEGNHVLFTGARALSLIEFNNILKQVDLSSVEYHMRSDVNDFQQWIKMVLCDPVLTGTFDDIKRDFARMDRKFVRHRMVEATNDRLNHLLNLVKPKGYV